MSLPIHVKRSKRLRSREKERKHKSINCYLASSKRTLRRLEVRSNFKKSRVSYRAEISKVNVAPKEGTIKSQKENATNSRENADGLPLDIDLGNQQRNCMARINQLINEFSVILPRP
jgi:hypothetical protein